MFSSGPQPPPTYPPFRDIAVVVATVILNASKKSFAEFCGNACVAATRSRRRSVQRFKPPCPLRIADWIAEGARSQDPRQVGFERIAAVFGGRPKQSVC